MLGLFFGFNGRINRVTYWLGNIVVGFVGFFGLMFGIMLAGAGIDAKSPESVVRALSTMGLTVGPIMLAMSWAGLSLQVKRFHDRGRTGVLTLAPVVPMFMLMTTIIGGSMAGKPFQQVAAEAQMYVNILWLINFAFFIDLGCLPGKEGPNKYGDSPNGGFGMGRPSAPMAPSGRPAPQAAGGAGLGFLGNADKAMEQAIAERATAAARPASAAAPRPAMATVPAARPAMAPAPTGFGRKPTR